MARYIIKLEHTDIEVNLKVIRLQVRKQGLRVQTPPIGLATLVLL